MKRMAPLFFVAALVFSLNACAHVSVDRDGSEYLHYHCGDISVDTVISEEEAAQLLGVIDGKALYSDNPSCGFDESISFQIGGQTFCPACDGCCIVQDCHSGQFFNISESERETIDRIFEAYGGGFPCV